MNITITDSYVEILFSDNNKLRMTKKSFYLYKYNESKNSFSFGKYHFDDINQVESITDVANSRTFNNFANSSEIDTAIKAVADTYTAPDPPTFVSGEIGLVDEFTLNVTFDTALDPTKTDGSYSLSASKGLVTLSNPTISGAVLTLTTSRAIESTEQISFAYTNSGDNPLQNSGNTAQVQTLSGALIINNTTFYLSDEFLVNTELDVAAPWLDGGYNAGITISGGQADFATSSNTRIESPVSESMSGTLYIVYEIKSYTSGTPFIWIPDSNEGGNGIAYLNTSVGTHVLEFDGTGSENFVFYVVGGSFASGGTWSLGRISLKKKYDSSAQIPTITTSFITDAEPNKIKLVYDLALYEAYSNTTNYTVSGGKTVTDVSVSNNTVTVTVDSNYTDQDTITLSYDGTNPDRLETIYGGVAGSLTDRAITNSIINPTVASAIISEANKNIIDITFTELLNGSFVPATSAFTVSGITGSPTVSSVSISGSIVSLTMSADASEGDSPLVSYTKPGTNWLRDNSGGNEVISFSDFSVTNNIPTSNLFVNPGFDTDTDWDKASADVTISGGEAHFNTTTNDYLGQTITVDGTQLFEYTITSYTRGDPYIWMAGAAGGVVYLQKTTGTFSFNYDTTGNTTGSFRIYGGGVGPGGQMSIDNVSIGGGAASNNPEFSSGNVGSISDSIAEITFDESLASGNTDGTHTIVASGGSVSTSSPTIVGGKLRLTLSRAISAGESLTYAYTNSGTNPLQNASGEQVLTFSARTITNSISSGNVQLMNADPIFASNDWTTDYKENSNNRGPEVPSTISSDKREGTYSLQCVCSDFRKEVLPKAYTSGYLSGGTLGPQWGRLEWNNEYWIGVSLKVTATSLAYMSTGGTELTLVQSHTIPANWNHGACCSGDNSWTIGVLGGGASPLGRSTPTFAVHSNVFSLNHTYNQITTCGAFQYNTDGYYTFVDRGWVTPYSNVANKWLDFVLHFRQSPDNDGFMECWMRVEGESGYTKIFDHTGPNTHIHASCSGNIRERVNSLTFGPYNYNNIWLPITTRFDSIRVVDAEQYPSCTFNDVAVGGIS
jgi:uncharacterized repeat protein (TIGR02059 family)